MSELFFERWFWIILVALISIVIIPFLIIWLLITLPPLLSMFISIFLILSWGVVAGYKEWVLFKEEEEKHKRK